MNNNIQILAYNSNPIELETLFKKHIQIQDTFLEKNIRFTINSNWYIQDKKKLQETIRAILKENTNSKCIIHFSDSKLENNLDCIQEIIRSPQKNIETIIHHNNLSNEEIKQLRLQGIYRFLPKEHNQTEFEKILENTSISLLLKTKSKKQEIPDVTFKLLATYDEFFEYYATRFKIWNTLGYISPEYITKSKLEIDPFDIYSIALGGFIDNELVVLSRIITPCKQEQTNNITQEIINNEKNKQLVQIIQTKPKNIFPIFENTDTTNDLETFINRYTTKNQCVEFSRMLITEQKYKGMSLSKKMAFFHNYVARNILHADIGFAVCLQTHVKQNIQNGFTGYIPTIEQIFAKDVAQFARGIYVNLEEWTNINNEKIKEFEKLNFKL